MNKKARRDLSFLPIADLDEYRRTQYAEATEAKGLYCNTRYLRAEFGLCCLG